MTYRGLVPHDMTSNVETTVELLQAYDIPDSQSWRNIPNLGNTFVWQVKPPGVWVILMRQDEWLVTSNLHVPLDVDYEAVYTMLAAHKSALLCRLDSDIGLVGIAASKVGERFIPLIPGFLGAASKLMLPDGVVSNPAEVFDELVAENDPSWPAGIQKPSIIHLQSAHSLLQADHRLSWLKKCPEGLWLLTSDPKGFQIYEVLG